MRSGFYEIYKNYESLMVIPNLNLIKFDQLTATKSKKFPISF